MTTHKGFYSSLGPEATIQQSVIRYMQLAYPSWIVVHPANEGKRTRWEQLKAKVLGLRAGVSDLFIFAPGARCLVLELKSTGNKPTPLQKHFLELMAGLGFSATWADSFDAAKVIIDEWGRNK